MARTILRRIPALLLLGAVSATAGCVHLPCWCDDDDNPFPPGRDGRRSASVAPGDSERHAPTAYRAQPDSVSRDG